MTVSSQSATPASEKTRETFRDKNSGRTGSFVSFSKYGLKPEEHAQRWKKFVVNGLTIPNTYDKVNKDRVGVLFTDNYVAAILADGNSRDAAKVAEFVVRTAAIELFKKHGVLPTISETGEIVNATTERLIAYAKAHGLDGATTLSMTILAPDGHYRFAKIGDSPIYTVEKGIPTQLGDEEHIMIGKEAKPAKGMDAHTYFENDNRMATGICTGFKAQEWVETGEGVLVPKSAILTLSDGLTKNMPVVVDSKAKITSSTREFEIFEAIEEALGHDNRLDRTLLRVYMRDVQRSTDPELRGGQVRIRGALAHRLAPDDKSGIMITREDTAQS